MTPQDAKLALDMIAKVNIPASDEALATVARLRSSLHKIVSGKLVVVEPPVLQPASENDEQFDGGQA